MKTSPCPPLLLCLPEPCPLFYVLDQALASLLQSTFYKAAAFNKDIDGWDTSKVTSLSVRCFVHSLGSSSSSAFLLRAFPSWLALSASETSSHTSSVGLPP